MKKLLFLILIVLSSSSIYSQCKIIYQKSNGHFAYDENCAKEVKRANRYSDKQMKRLIKKELENARNLSNQQVRAYGNRKMAEAKEYRRKKDAEYRAKQARKRRLEY